MHRTLASRAAAVLAVLGLIAGCAHVPPGAAPSAAPAARAVVAGSRIPQRIDPATGRPHDVASARIYTPEELAGAGVPGTGAALQRLLPSGR